MKRLLSVLLVIGFAFSLFGGITAKGSNEDGCEITSFSYESDGNTYFVETQKYDQYAIAKLYKNGVLIQESVADPVADKLETNIYEADGSVQSTQVSTLNSVISIESNTDGKFTQPVEPGPQIEITEELLMVNPRYREPTIYSEPVDNTDLYISMSQDGLIWICE